MHLKTIENKVSRQSNMFEISRKQRRTFSTFVYITNIFLRYICIHIKHILYCVPSRAHFY